MEEDYGQVSEGQQVQDASVDSPPDAGTPSPEGQEPQDGQERRQNLIPQDRFNEVYGNWKTAQEEKEQLVAKHNYEMEQLKQLANLQQAQQPSQAPEPKQDYLPEDYRNDPSWNMVKDIMEKMVDAKVGPVSEQFNQFQTQQQQWQEQQRQAQEAAYFDQQFDAMEKATAEELGLDERFPEHVKNSIIREAGEVLLGLQRDPMNKYLSPEMQLDKIKRMYHQAASDAVNQWSSYEKDLVAGRVKTVANAQEAQPVSTQLDGSAISNEMEDLKREYFDPSSNMSDEEFENRRDRLMRSMQP